jgi:tape measure domain-containing protein
MDELIRVVVDDAPATSAFNRIASASSGADAAINRLGSSVNTAQQNIAGLAGTTRANTSAAAAATQQNSSLGSSFLRLANSAQATNSRLETLWSVGKVYLFSHAVRSMWDIASSAASTYINRLTEIQQTMSLLSAVDPSSLTENFDYIVKTADKFGVRISALQDNYAKLAMAAQGTAMKTDDVRKIFEATALASRVLHLSASQVDLAFLAIVQMASKGTVSMEELRRQFAERIPGALPALSRELGVTTGELIKFISQGKAAADKMLPYLATALERTYGGGLKKASTALDAEINRIDSSIRIFFKQVYDADGATGPAAAIRALNEKLVQPEVAILFANFVNQISGNIEDFIRSMTNDEIERGAESFLSILQSIANIATMAGNGLKWMAENISVVAPLLGAYMGAQVGSAFGPTGAVIGAGVGAVAGYVFADKVSNGSVDTNPQSSAGMQQRILELEKTASGLKQKISQYDELDFARKKSAEKQLAATTAEINSLQTILNGRLTERNYVSRAQTVNPPLPKLGSGNLEQLIGGGTGNGPKKVKRDPFEALMERLHASESDTSRTFYRDLGTLYNNRGKLGVDGYREAVEALIATQKYAKDIAKSEQDAQDALNSARRDAERVTNSYSDAHMELLKVMDSDVWKNQSPEWQARIKSLYDAKEATELNTQSIINHRLAMSDLNKVLAKTNQEFDDLQNLISDTNAITSGVSPARAAADRALQALQSKKNVMELFGDEGSKDIIAVTEREIKTLQAKLGNSSKKMRADELQEWSNNWKGVSDSFVDAMKGGSDSVLDYLENIFKNAVLEPLLRPAGDFMADLLYGSSSTAGGGWLGTLGSILSFEGGGSTPSGPRTGGVDGRGGFPVILHPDEDVIDRRTSGSTNGSGGSVKHISVQIHNTIGDVASKSEVVAGMQAVRSQIMSDLSRDTQYS